MKNIHLLKTDKPSRLFIIDKSKMFKSEAPYLSFSTVGGRVHKVEGSELYQPQNMYITSDEDIKEPCWCVNTIKNTWTKDIIYYQGAMPAYHFVGFKKIVLTTDEDLIKDGIQKIEDEFLEWFVKNSDCEFVDVEKMLQTRHGIDWYDLPNQKEGREVDGIYRITYKLNIPKKDEWISPMQKFKKKNIIDTWLEKNGNPEIEKQVELQAASLLFTRLPKVSTVRDGFVEGATWMAERTYSEEEVVNLLVKCSEWQLPQAEEDIVKIKEWFENNKKN